jgi:kynurenine formamidase
LRTQFELASGRTVTSDLDEGIDIGIPLRFKDRQPAAFGAPPATAHPFEAGGATFDTRLGAGCNVSTVVFIPHCNGTHTESIRHITDDGPSIHAVAPLGLIPATVITVTPEPASTTADSYDPPKRDHDQLITRSSLHALRQADREFLEAVLIRTAPNDPGKLTRDYAQEPGPHLSLEAVEHLILLGARHLLVDMASIDRPDDDGVMSIHHRWFGVPPGSSAMVDPDAAQRTVTEMIYVPDAVEDGPWLLQIHTAPFDSDAAPSRPVLFPVTNLSQG